MKSTKTILTLILSIIFFGSNAQTKNDKIVIQLNSINTVVIMGVSGGCSIFLSKSNEISAKSELHVSGDIWGWRFPNERPVFKIYSRQSKDTLYIEMPLEFSFKTIGISTYSEQITSVIQISEDKHIIVQKANKLIIEDEFSYLNIQNTAYLECNNISKNNMNSIICDASERLTINGKKNNNQFEFQGTGNGKSIFKAIKISLTLK